MDESAENLALSRTFSVRNGELSQAQFDEDSLSTARSLRPGTVVDAKYEVQSLIASGGMGAVYRVHHLLLQKDMALKTFRSHGFSFEAWQRFQREARAIAKLKHRNIVDVFDFGVADSSLPYYTMELLEGRSIARELRADGPTTIKETIQLFREVADALAHAHKQSIIHRDIKPDNIILVPASGPPSKARRAILVDFGVAKLVEGDESEQSNTRAGTIFGSPLYMSPEQSLGMPLDLRTDVYSFGCTLFECLTGQPPFRGSSAFVTMLMHQNDTAPTLSSRAPDAVFSKRLEATVAKLLAKNREDRFENFEQVIEELDLCASSLGKSQTPGKREASGSLSNAGGSAYNNRPGMTGRRKILIIAASTVCLLGALAVPLIGGIRSHKAAIKQAQLGNTKFDGERYFSSSAKYSQLPNIDPTAKHYLTGRKKDAFGEEKVFDFPPADKVGSLALKDGNTTKVVKAEGHVVTPANVRVILIAGDGPLSNPELFKRFGPNDLYGVTVSPQLISTVDEDWSDKHIHAISALTGLESFELSRCETVTPAIGADLSRLKNLKSINLSYTKINVSALEQMPNLDTMEQINICGISHLTKVLSRLAEHDSKVNALLLNWCSLTAADLRIIGKLKHLTVLSMNGNSLGSAKLKALIPAAELEKLDVAMNELQDEDLKYLSQYPKLKDLSISKSHTTAAGIERLKKTLPHGCKLEFVEDYTVLKSTGNFAPQEEKP